MFDWVLMRPWINTTHFMNAEAGAHRCSRELLLSKISKNSQEIINDGVLFIKVIDCSHVTSHKKDSISAVFVVIFWETPQRNFFKEHPQSSISINALVLVEIWNVKKSYETVIMNMVNVESKGMSEVLPILPILH